jgi:hypothetical protein
MTVALWAPSKTMAVAAVDETVLLVPRERNPGAYPPTKTRFSTATSGLEME